MIKSSWIWYGAAAFAAWYVLSSNMATASPVLAPVPRQNRRRVAGNSPQRGQIAYSPGLVNSDNEMSYQGAGNAGYGPGQYDQNGMGAYP